MLHSITLQSDGEGGFTATSVRVRPEVLVALESGQGGEHALV